MPLGRSIGHFPRKNLKNLLISPGFSRCRAKTTSNTSFPPRQKVQCNFHEFLQRKPVNSFVLFHRSAENYEPLMFTSQRRTVIEIRTFAISWNLNFLNRPTWIHNKLHPNNENDSRSPTPRRNRPPPVVFLPHVLACKIDIRQKMQQAPFLVCIQFAAFARFQFIIRAAGLAPGISLTKHCCT